MTAVQISDNDKIKIEEWFAAHCRDSFRCVVCGHNQWTIAEHVIQFSPFHGRHVIVGGVAYPAVGFLCNTCGQIVFVSALRIGLELEEARDDGK